MLKYSNQLYGHENKYALRARLPEAKFRDLVKVFALDLEANKIAA